MNQSPIAASAAWLRSDPRRFDVAVAAITVAMGLLLIQGAPDNHDTGWPEVAAGVGAFVMLALRRWQPILLLAISMAWTAVHVAVWERPTPLIFAALVLLATACVRLERRPAILLGGSIAVSLYLIGLVSNDAELGDARAVIGIAWTAGAVGIADAVRSWRRYKESADAQVRSAVLAAEADARQQVSEERLTIARELHDLLAHSMSVMNVQTGAALHLLRTDPDQAEQSLSAARDAGRTVLDELQELLAVLRRNDDSAPTASLPTVGEVEQLVEVMRSAGLAVTWNQVGGNRPLAPAVSLAAYRIIQEALTNAAKHGTGSAELTTQWDAEGLTIRVVNSLTDTASDGVDTSAGHGLIGMRERATTNGGRFESRSESGRHEVEAWLPATSESTVAP